MLPLRHASLGLILTFTGLLSGLVAGDAFADTAIEVGQAAPGFRLQDQNSQWHELDKYCGQWVVLYFYPKDNTPGCTTQACEFRDEIYAFRKANVNILGISLDDVKSHEDFASKHSLPFSLLSDADKQVALAYGVLKNYGVIKYSARETFLINPEGNIAKHYKKVNPKGHATDVIQSIRQLSVKNSETVNTRGH